MFDTREATVENGSVGIIQVVHTESKSIIADVYNSPVGSMTQTAERIKVALTELLCENCNGTGAVDTPTSTDEPECEECSGEGTTD